MPALRPDRLKTNHLIHALRQTLYPLSGSQRDFDPIMDLTQNARFVLIGEASHGTHEFYEIRAQITKRLIEERQFNAIIVESDWPDAYRINRYIVGSDNGQAAIESLSGYKRFPTWMWRNAVMLDFIGWVKQHNDHQSTYNEKTGFYGMDLYSLYTSIEAVIRYLSIVDPKAAILARHRYECFERYEKEPQAYGYATYFGLTETCEREVIQQLLDIKNHELEYAHKRGKLAEDDFFYTEQNARVIQNAEAYYRTMFQGHVPSWNIRDQHMSETITHITDYLSKRNGKYAKVIVWAHNSHLGDARATDIGIKGGEHNVGQLIRERYGAEVVNIGFTTDYGTVTAASQWDTPVQRKQVQPALQSSVEELFHQVNIPNFLLIPKENEMVQAELSKPLLERAIGVIYQPETERESHYFEAQISKQFDAIIHIDETRALEPLETTAIWHRGEEETYPFAV